MITHIIARPLPVIAGETRETLHERVAHQRIGSGAHAVANEGSDDVVRKLVRNATCESLVRRNAHPHRSRHHVADRNLPDANEHAHRMVPVAQLQSRPGLHEVELFELDLHAASRRSSARRHLTASLWHFWTERLYALRPSIPPANSRKIRCSGKWLRPRIARRKF